MNRKAEKILSWIANALSFVYLLFIVLCLFMINVPDFKEVFNQMNQQQGLDMSLGTFKASLTLLTIYLLVSLVLGVIGTFLIKKNRVLAACLLIVAALTAIFSSNLIALILWLIAGIMLFARRPNNKTTNSNHGESFNNNDKQHNRNSNNNTFDEETQQRKRKKDDDPYIY
ncbi:DUF4064 domain-containing protein [Staphylococcus gallinarum]|uniref:DUF4064 domain-containing protein n=1 Tax=Staphylococcus gallinarum TaxID=1293 RepID=A0A2T4SZK4_STAGA|nr:DUF4064 domain-containing protein [Staphylococcus gallinarum]MCD8820934.1 DUF4064 domain-containing protein [Staphylococcus gallinarum]MEB6242179.1 DUF4064 domain-containing protein [Staphylococcus gallinarum]MEB6295356.1 DUF4064 domain-containing protein [Staphylococcus gallinarum]PTL07365.1 hypothetical protein BUZ09_08790 [Staphylococcus gallinarum]PTL11041.1 hypothetical protein BUZ15_04465 [Staphylococcus gallinarum]